MTTEIIYTFDSGGGHDYDTLSAFETDTDVSLTGANDKVFAISNLTGTAAIFRNAAVENSDASHTGTMRGVPTEGNQAFIETANLASERVYKVGDHSKYFDVDAGDGIGKCRCQMYDSQNHIITALFVSGATTDINRFRVIESSPSCVTPFAGKDGTGATISCVAQATSYSLILREDYLELLQFCGTFNFNYAGDSYSVWANTNAHYHIANIVLYSCENDNVTNIAHAFSSQVDDVLFYNCIAYDIEKHGFYINTGIDETMGAICCTAVFCGGSAFYSSATAGIAIVFSCYGADAVSDTYSGFFDAPSDYNAEDNTTALPGANSTKNLDLVGGGQLDADYLATTTIGYGRNPYDDVTGTTDFGNFLWDGADEHPLFPFDIAGNARPNGGHGVDDTWDVGASQYSSSGASVYIDKSIGHGIGSGIGGGIG